MHKFVIEVVRNPLGWWDILCDDNVEARYLSEFQAREAGRTIAEQRQRDLIIHEEAGQPRLETYDPATKTVRPLADILSHAPSRSPAPSPSKRALLLLVEDGVDTRELYAEYLNYAGFTVVTAINGHEAIRLARLLEPELILMDIRMPGMDGLEATRDLKSDPAMTHIPVIALTADTSEAAMQGAREAGCAAFVVKPALPHDLAQYVRQVLERDPTELPQMPCINLDGT